MTSLVTAGAKMCHGHPPSTTLKTHWIIQIYGLGEHCSIVHSKFEEIRSSTWPENVGGRSSLFHFAAAFVQKTGQFALATPNGLAVYPGFQSLHAILVLVFTSVVQWRTVTCWQWPFAWWILVHTSLKNSGISPVETCSAYIDNHSSNLQEQVCKDIRLNKNLHSWKIFRSIGESRTEWSSEQFSDIFEVPMTILPSPISWGLCMIFISN